MPRASSFATVLGTLALTLAVVGCSADGSSSADRPAPDGGATAAGSPTSRPGTTAAGRDRDRDRDQDVGSAGPRDQEDATPEPDGRGGSGGATEADDRTTAPGPGPDDGHGPDDVDPAPSRDASVRTVAATWAQSGRAVRAGDGESTRVTCPPGGLAHPVAGTDVYTDDSSVCTAAVHMGLITFRAGGEVLIDHQPPIGYYRATTRHGISSHERMDGAGTFVFLGARGVPIEGSD